MSYIMVDVESEGPIPGDYSMVSLGAVVVDSTLTKRFGGRLHRGTLYSARTDKDGNIRLVFSLEASKSPLSGYQAGKTYRNGANLAEDLLPWLGDDFEELLCEVENDIEGSDLEIFIGLEADLQIEHFLTSKHEDPFCIIKKITPPGCLVPDEIL